MSALRGVGIVLRGGQRPANARRNSVARFTQGCASVGDVHSDGTEADAVPQCIVHADQSMLSPDEDAIRMFHRGNSTNQAATRRKLSANSVFQCLISSDPLAVVVDQRILGRAQSICRPAQSIVGPSQSAICKVWCAQRPARSTLSRARSSLRRSQSAHAKTEDTNFEARTAQVVLLSSFFLEANAHLSSRAPQARGTCC